jgi:hypothetical protein
MEGRPEDLERHPAVAPPGTKRVELSAPRPAALLARLRGAGGVRDATLIGDSIRALAWSTPVSTRTRCAGPSTSPGSSCARRARISRTSSWP